ncbi:MAG: hypothetical protein QOI57_2865 [Rubrobacteraceae bacterium]|nr:hypothetical protein [Rubrobacteraceae bacterium]
MTTQLVSEELWEAARPPLSPPPQPPGKRPEEWAPFAELAAILPAVTEFIESSQSR